MRFTGTIPRLRIFSEEAARDFYVRWLGCRVDFEHRFAPDMPLFLQVSRDALRLHLTEHHGDCTPGSAISVDVEGLDELLAELRSRPYPALRPGIETMEWGLRQLTLTDPFGNRIHFTEPS